MHTMTQYEMKQAVARAARDFVAAHLPAGAILGVGTGSTANCFIDEIAVLKSHLGGTVASSEATRQRLEGHGIRVLDLNDVEHIGIYVDGADEIDGSLCMIKGGGGALTREKIVAAVADTFVCICDTSKRVTTLGRFPLPVEVIPMARAHVARQLSQLGGTPKLREGFITDNGNLILDVLGLHINQPATLESRIDGIAGVVSNGLFARRGADVLLLATPSTVEVVKR